MTRLTGYEFQKEDGLRRYYYDTEFGWITIEVYPDGSNTVECEDSSYEEIRQAIQQIEIGLNVEGIQLK